MRTLMESMCQNPKITVLINLVSRETIGEILLLYVIGLNGTFILDYLFILKTHMPQFCPSSSKKASQ